MKKQEARQQRELHILQTLFKHLEKNRVLDLTMSDIAKISECSMGVIYSHFPSKEDLIIAAANQMRKENLASIEIISENAENDLDKLLTIILGLSVLICEKPHFYALSQLAMNPNIWTNASNLRVEEGKQLSEVILLKVVDLVSSISKERDLGLSQNDVELFSINLCAIVLGIIELKMSGFSMAFKQEENTEEPVKYILPTLFHILSNWGIKDANLLEYIENIYKTVSKDMI